MSDFLFQLAERALALPPLVRPRLQSIYEPSAASVLQNPLEEHVEVPAEPPRVIEPAYEQTLQSPDDKAQPKPASEETDGKPTSEWIDREPVSERVDRKLLPREERDAKRQPPSEQPALAQRGARRLPLLPDENESADKIETDEPQAPQHRTVRKEERKLDRAPAGAAKQPVTPPAETQPHPAERLVETNLENYTPATQKKSPQPQTFSHDTKTRVEKAARHPIVVTVGSAQQRREEHARSTLPLTSAPREGPPRASAPAVRVTIGRVEVRAVIPPTAPPKIASPAAPKLSLEDYLKQRRSA